MSPYYDEPTNTTYYDSQMVINITEYDKDSDRDTDLFIVYDQDDSLFYVYGHRGGKNYINYTKTFENISDLYDFVSLTTGVGENHSLSISINYIDGLTNYDEYNEIKSKISKYNEVVAYDNITELTRKEFRKFLCAFF